MIAVPSLRLYLAITPHGYGHFSLADSVLGALTDLVAGSGEPVTLDVTVESAKEPGPFLLGCRHEPRSEDFGLLMRSAREIDLEASAARLLDLHRDWPAAVARAAAVMAAHHPDVVVTSLSYLACAAATRLGVPVIGLSPLNWLGIGRYLFAKTPGMDRVFAEMAEAYGGLERMLLPTPAMPQSELPNRLVIGPVSRPGRWRRPEIAAALGIPQATGLALLNFGGMSGALDLAGWPADLGGWRVIVHGAVPPGHPALIDGRALAQPFRDQLASVDAVIGKPGYGMVADCACAGTPFLYVDRPDWPEAPYLIDWLAQAGRCAEVAADHLAAGRIAEALDRLTALPRPAPVAPSGALQAARLIFDVWCRRSAAPAGSEVTRA
ncbi:hypothetical protein CKO38_06965 [Rhodospirillum rubrum]|uniref:hypothetical protein n=1 Tax=Rhodospirillum rubrum TaxID=1085 RepID=UPI001905F43F|nr:hypothetical protein [Rhodospirillum rubrum]MBK1664757.1 hypothetical protein [Rhodospirillum rubrum]MBK1676417.1 hypothetical protein [Rhodospirillum rubrum]